MTRRQRVLVSVTALLAPVLAAAPAVGQSLAGASGLGFPLEAVDARGRALGSAGVGLFGPSVVPADPAAAADLGIPTVTFTFQTSWIASDGFADASAVSTRFPVLGLAYPISAYGVATFTFGGFLDQGWNVELQRDLDLGESTARATDLFESEGGVSAVRVGFSRRLSPSLAVGVAAGSYVGGTTRRFTRTFDSTAVGTTVPPLSIGGRWAFSGPTVTAGAQFDAGAFLRVAGSLTWSGTLHADPTDDTDGAPADWEIPTLLRVGASGALTEALSVVAGFGYGDWSSSGVTEAGAGGTAWDAGVGIEWSGGTILGRQSPIRLGYRSSRMPFHFQGHESKETLWAGGLGLNLAQVSNIPLARLDLALERGHRTAGALSENFWRSTVTVRVAGF